MFFIIFVLLSCFALIHSAAVAVLEQRYTTPPRSRPNFSILQESPGKIEEAERERKASELDTLSPPQQPYLFEQKQSLYHVYIAATNPGTNEHMTLRKTIVNANTYQQILQKLGVSDTNSPIAASLPCKIGLQLYHDGPTGLMSPSRSIERAFLLSTPFSVRHWIRISEIMNQSCPLVSDFLGLIPDANVELGHHPLAHTNRSVCERGEVYQATYTLFQIEMRRIIDPEMQRMLQRNISRMEKLKDLINRTDSYLKQDISTLSKDFPKVFSGKNINDVLKTIEAIYTKMNKTVQDRERITMTLHDNYTNAENAAYTIQERYQQIYDKIDDDLRPLFKAAGPNPAICHMIASLELMALRRDMGSVE